MIDGAESNNLASTSPEIVTPGGGVTPLSGNPEETQPRIMPRQMPPGVLRGNIQLGTPNLSVEAANVRILTTDNDNVNRVVMGKLGDNEYGLKVSQPGYDAATADNNNLIFNSSQNVFKIAIVVPYTYAITATDISNTYINLVIPHGLTFAPQITASFTTTIDDAIRLMPYTFFNPGTSYFAQGPEAQFTIDRVDDTNIYVYGIAFTAVGLGFFILNSVLTFKFYCLQETANPLQEMV